MPSWSSAPHLPQALPCGPEGSRGRDVKEMRVLVELESAMLLCGGRCWFGSYVKRRLGTLQVEVVFSGKKGGGKIGFQM